MCEVIDELVSCWENGLRQRFSTKEAGEFWSKPQAIRDDIERGMSSMFDRNDISKRPAVTDATFVLGQDRFGDNGYKDMFLPAVTSKKAADPAPSALQNFMNAAKGTLGDYWGKATASPGASAAYGGLTGAALGGGLTGLSALTSQDEDERNSALSRALAGAAAGGSLGAAAGYGANKYGPGLLEKAKAMLPSTTPAGEQSVPLLQGPEAEKLLNAATKNELPFRAVGSGVGGTAGAVLGAGAGNAAASYLGKKFRNTPTSKDLYSAARDAVNASSGDLNNPGKALFKMMSADPQIGENLVAEYAKTGKAITPTQVLSSLAGHSGDLDLGNRQQLIDVYDQAVKQGLMSPTMNPSAQQPALSQLYSAAKNGLVDDHNYGLAVKKFGPTIGSTPFGNNSLGADVLGDLASSAQKNVKPFKALGQTFGTPEAQLPQFGGKGSPGLLQRYGRGGMTAAGALGLGVLSAYLTSQLENSARHKLSLVPALDRVLQAQQENSR